MDLKLLTIDFSYDHRLPTLFPIKDYINHLFSSVLPSLVEIIEPSLDIRESHSVTFECLVKGANPAPRITWLKDEFVYSQSLQYVSLFSLRNISSVFLTRNQKRRL